MSARIVRKGRFAKGWLALAQEWAALELALTRPPEWVRRHVKADGRLHTTYRAPQAVALPFDLIEGES